MINEDESDWLMTESKKKTIQKNEVEVLKYAVHFLFIELRARSHDCDSCYIAKDLFRDLKNILDEAGIKPESLSNY